MSIFLIFKRVQQRGLKSVLCIRTKRNFCASTDKHLAEWSESTKNNDKIILHTVPWHDKSLNHFSPFPFHLKLEAHFAFNKLEYEVEDKTFLFHPKINKSPWITWKGEHIGGTQIILDKLSKHYKIDNDKHLTDKEKAISHAFRTSLEEGLYWIDIRRRYICDNNNDTYFLKYIGGPPNGEWMQKAWRGVIEPQCWPQGYGRLPVDTLYEMYCEHINNFLTFLGDKEYVFGDKVSNIDFVAYSIIGSWYSLPFKIESSFDKGNIREKEAIDYIKRVENVVFGLPKYWK